MDDYKFNFVTIYDSVPWFLTGFAGVMGRLMLYAKRVQEGRSKPLGWLILWDVPIALSMGWIALGLGVWVHTPFPVTFSIALIASYLGPNMIDIVFFKWLEAKFDLKKKGDDDVEV